MYSSIGLILFLIIIFFRARQIRIFKLCYHENKEIAYKNLDQIINAKYWVGNELELLYRKTDDLKNNKLYRVFETQLCKSKNDNFIILKIVFDVKNEKGRIENASPINKDKAKSFLDHDMEAYIRLFGLPETA